MFPVIELFTSIDGEGPRAGGLSAFIRFAGCNLRCSWCDTDYSYGRESECQHMTAKEITAFADESPANNVTITGGEPLLQPQLPSLLEMLVERGLNISIETNGSIDIAEFKEDFPSVQFIVDYKLNGSEMSSMMCEENLSIVDKNDVYKFVVSSREDLEQAEEIIRSNNLDSRTQVFISPVLGSIDPAEIVEFLKERKLSNVRLQLQLHKYIWNPETRGV